MVAVAEELEGAVEPTKSQKVWFDDGNVVLQAENVQFRAHRSILSKHSVILASILDVAQPDGEAIVEGCSVVKLSDAPRDVEDILLALYGDPLYTNRKEEIRFRSVAAMIRLGIKYEIPHLRDEGLARLKLECPRKLEEFDRLNVRGGHRFLRYPSGIINANFATINLAHECKIQSILPSLYLFSLQCDLDKSLLESDDLPIPYPAMRSCIHGRQKLLEAAAKKVYKWTQQIGTIEKCQSKKTCQDVSRRVMKDQLGRTGRSSGRYLTFRTWKEYAAGEAGTKYLKLLCGPCRSYTQVAHEEGRRAAWEELPTYFMLPKWQDLKDFKD